MSTRRDLIKTGIALALLGETARPAKADEGMFVYFSKGIDAVFETVNKWNALIDDLTNKEKRNQVRRRMERMNKDVSQLMAEKRQMLRHLTADTPSLPLLQDDLFEVLRNTERLKQSLIDVNGTLNQVTDYSMEQNLMLDLEGKSDFLTKIKLNALTQEARMSAKTNLQGAIGKLTLVQNKISDCFRKLR